MQVYTTLDLGMQDVAERVMAEAGEELDLERQEAAKRDIAAIAARQEELQQRKQQHVVGLVAAATVRRSAQARKSADKAMPRATE